MTVYDRFHAFLRQDFYPLLRADGFKGSGLTFRRTRGEAIHVINIQGSRYAYRCCVNLGVHYTFLPLPGFGETRLPDSKALKEYECQFRDRLREIDKQDKWWEYGATYDECIANIKDLVELYKRRGTDFFAKFEPFPEVFERVTPEDLKQGDGSKRPIRIHTLRMHPHDAVLTMARIMDHLGRADERRQFIEIGLQYPDAPAAFRQDLERLRGGG